LFLLIFYPVISIDNDKDEFYFHDKYLKNDLSEELNQIFNSYRTKFNHKHDRNDYEEISSKILSEHSLNKLRSMLSRAPNEKLRIYSDAKFDLMFKVFEILEFIFDNLIGESSSLDAGDSTGYFLFDESLRNDSIEFFKLFLRLVNKFQQTRHRLRDFQLYPHYLNYLRFYFKQLLDQKVKNYNKDSIERILEFIKRLDQKEKSTDTTLFYRSPFQIERNENENAFLDAKVLNELIGKHFRNDTNHFKNSTIDSNKIQEEQEEQKDEENAESTPAEDQDDEQNTKNIVLE